MDPISLALAIANIAAPSVARWIFGDKGEKIAGQVIETAKRVTGASTADAAVDILKSDPQIALQLQREMIGFELSLWAEETERLKAVNQTMRSEYASGDAYVRRWRPTFGYAVALAWVVQTAGVVGGFGYAILFEPLHADRIINAVATVTGALTAQWGVALTVLGVNISQRSKDKQLAAGVTAGPGILDGIVQRITGAKGGG